MAYKHRRRARGTWFPTLGRELLEGADSSMVIGVSVNVPDDGTTNVVVIPITYDDPRDDAEQFETSQLTEFVGQEYILQNILGKCHVNVGWHMQGGQPPTNPQPVIAKAGFFVARAEDSTVDETDPKPIGANTLARTKAMYSPLSPDTTREPWIWVRSWALCPDLVQISTQLVDGPIFAQDAFPYCNSLYGSVMDGPHIHTKTKRRVRQDERLWFALAAHNLPTNSSRDPLHVEVVSAYLDIRIRGSLVKARNHSAF